MKLQTYFERIYNYIPSSFYEPSRKNSGIFVLRFLSTAGSSKFRYKEGKIYTSADVPLERKLFDGSRSLTADVKNSLQNLNEENLTNLLVQAIPRENDRALMMAFGLPESFKENHLLFCNVLVEQFKCFVSSDTDEADDIVYLEYQKRLDTPSIIHTESTPAKARYQDDVVYLRSKYRPVYEVDVYQPFQHTWSFVNTGKQTWRGRKLVLLNYNPDICYSDLVCIEIPVVSPNQGFQATVGMKARGIESKFEYKWVMVDSDGKDCFVNSSQFAFVVEILFRINKEGGGL